MKFLLSLFAIGVFMINPAYAQDQSEAAPLNSITFRKAISDMNRIKPLQNPKYEKSKDILTRNIIGSENKVIGEVKDVLINKESGQVVALLLSFDRLRLGQPAYLDYEAFGIESVSNGYRLALNTQDLEKMHSELPKTVEEFGGELELLSLAALTEISVKTPNGDTIGQVGNLLFDEYAKLAEGVFILVNYRTIRDEGVAIPYAAAQFEAHNGKFQVMIKDEFADLILETARQ